MTEPQDNEEDLRVLGHISRIIAHDYKNLIMSIIGNAELAGRAKNDAEQLERCLHSIRTAAEITSQLADKVLNYSASEATDIQPVNFAEVVRDAERLLRPTLHAGISLSVVMAEIPMWLKGDRCGMMQLLINLGTNAREAIGEKNGMIELSLERIEDELQLMIRDTGKGIDKAHLDKIFDAQYTTRKLNAGHGLGMAICQRIVAAHGGDIAVSSRVGEYTSILVRLPATEPELPEANPICVVDAHGSDAKCNVLLVDDEPSIRSLGMDMLHMLNYRVTVAEDGESALDMIKRNPDYFDVVLTDSRMPQMGGFELALHLYGLRPELPVILITAFNMSMTRQEQHEANFRSIIPKPFMLDDLSQAIEAALVTST